MRAAAFRPAQWSETQIAAYLFVSLWLTYGFLAGDFTNSNSVTRMALIFAIIDHHALTIGDFARLTLDKALFQGQLYADKTPGLSFTALPFVAAFVWAARVLDYASPPVFLGRLSVFFGYATVVATFFTGGLFTAASAAAVYRLARYWQASRSAALYGTLGFAVATPTLGWASGFFAHAMAGACLFLAFAGVVLGAARKAGLRRAALDGLAVGLLLAWAAVVEPTAAVAAALIGAFGLWELRRTERRRRAVTVAAALLGAIVGLLPMLVYNWAAFGSLFHIGYENVVAFPGQRRGLLGVSWPQPAILYELVFGSRRGLLWFAPIVVVAPLAYWAAFRALSIGTWLTLLGVPVAYLLIDAGYIYWSGGGSTGPRFLVPSLAFLSVPLEFLWQRSGEGARLALAGLAVLSAADALVCASVTMNAFERYANPLLDFIFPLFVAGRIRNLLTLAGMEGYATLAAIPLLWLAVGVATAALGRRSTVARSEAGPPRAAARSTAPRIRDARRR